MTRVLLDQGLAPRAAALLRLTGWDALHVSEVSLDRAEDSEILDFARQERRTCITLDHDFGQVTRFPPAASAGIVILEAGPRVSIRSILDRLKDFLYVLERHSVVGSLWIIEPGRVRIHLSKDDQ